MARLDQLKGAFEVIHLLPLAREDADAIIELAQMSVDVDGTESKDEIALFFGIGKILYQLANVGDEAVPTFATDQDDDERLFELATSLKGTPARELAFAVVRALAEADLEIVEAEDAFMVRLRKLLSITPERAEELDTVLRSA